MKDEIKVRQKILVIKNQPPSIEALCICVFFEADGANQQNKLAFAPPVRTDVQQMLSAREVARMGSTCKKTSLSLEGKEKYCVFIGGRP